MNIKYLFFLSLAIPCLVQGMDKAIQQDKDLAQEGLKKRQKLEDGQLSHNERAMLYAAAENGEEDKLKELLARCDNVNFSDKKRGHTPLHRAAACGHAGCVQLLLEHGANVEALGNYAESPLHAAAVNKHDQCTKILESALKKVRHNRWVNDFTSKSQNQKNQTLRLCAQLGQAPYVRVALKYGAQVNAPDDLLDHNTALHDAAKFGHQECVNMLVAALQVNLDVENRLGETALHLAAREGHSECLSALLQAGADKEKRNAVGQTALHCAVQKGQKKCVQALIAANVNLEATVIEDGGTALHDAAYLGQNECLSILLDAGACKNATTRDGDTPLHFAVRMGHIKCVEVLLKAQVNMEARNLDGETPLLEAAASGKNECLSVLLKAGANKDAVSEKGNKALQVAIEHGHVQCLELLLEDADIDEVVDMVAKSAFKEQLTPSVQQAIEKQKRALSNKPPAMPIFGDTITIYLKEGTEVQLTYRQAKISETLCHLLKDATSGNLTLSKISFATWRHIFGWTAAEGDLTALEILREHDQTLSKALRKTYESDIEAVLKELSSQELCDIIQVANYLNIKIMLALAEKIYAQKCIKQFAEAVPHAPLTTLKILSNK